MGFPNFQGQEGDQGLNDEAKGRRVRFANAKKRAKEARSVPNFLAKKQEKKAVSFANLDGLLDPGQKVTSRGSSSAVSIPKSQNLPNLEEFNSFLNVN